MSETETTVTVRTTATDRKTGMTLDELAAFVQDAMRAGIPGDSPIRVRTGYNAQIREVQVPR